MVVHQVVQLGVLEHQWQRLAEEEITPLRLALRGFRRPLDCRRRLLRGRPDSSKDVYRPWRNIVLDWLLVP